MKYRYHLLRNWSSSMMEGLDYFNWHKNTKEDEEAYLRGEHNVWGYYEEWVILTEEEFEEYKRNPPNYDYFIRLLGKEKLK